MGQTNFLTVRRCYFGCGDESGSGTFFAMVRELWSEIRLFVIRHLLQGHVAVGHLPTFWPCSPHWGHHHGGILASVPRWIHGKEIVSTLSGRVTDPYSFDPDPGFRIQHFRLNTDPDIWFYNQNWKKFLAEKIYIYIYIFFLSKIAIYLSLTSIKKPLALKTEHPALQNMKFLSLFFIFVGPFCPSGAGSGFRIRIHRPDSIRIQSGSGSETPGRAPSVPVQNSFYSTNQLQAANLNW